MTTMIGTGLDHWGKAVSLAARHQGGNERRMITNEAGGGHGSHVLKA